MPVRGALRLLHLIINDIMRNFTKNNKITLIIIISLCYLFISAFARGKDVSAEERESIFTEEHESIFTEEHESAYCSYVIDGDTIIVNERIKVRLIGIDTPETDAPFYKEAKDFLIKSAAKKKVLLGYDKRKKDRYGRTLAYVYLPDGTLLNEELIKKGLAEVFYKEDFKYKKEFISLEDEAKKAKTGIWSK